LGYRAEEGGLIIPSGVYLRTESHRKKLSESRKGEKNHNFGKHFTEEHRRKLSDAKLVAGTRPPSRLGSHTPQHVRDKISASNKGRPKPPRSEVHCRKISVALKYRKIPKEILKKRSDSTSGDKSCHWKGGISFEPYCPKFTNEFKERVRSFFGYKCVECSVPQTGRKLDVHHVNFNKQSCCDESVPLFVPLCHKCHGRTQKNRHYWERRFTEIINRDYGGKCYFTKEEMEKL
jgi:hypothetical protein